MVTGWKIVAISGGTHGFSTGDDATASVNDNGDITLTTPYNFADRKCTDKDKFEVSGRVFSQGAYFDVPEGVSSIIIEPYWAKAVFLAVRRTPMLILIRPIIRWVANCHNIRCWPMEHLISSDSQVRPTVSLTSVVSG